MYRDLATALALLIALAASACGKDVENPDFPTSLSCAISKDNCKGAKPATPAPAKPTNPPASVVRPSP